MAVMEQWFFISKTVYLIDDFFSYAQIRQPLDQILVGFFLWSGGDPVRLIRQRTQAEGQGRPVQLLVAQNVAKKLLKGWQQKIRSYKFRP